MIDQRFVRPEYRTGAYFMNTRFPNVNDLTAGIMGDQPATIYGTDPAGFAADTLAAYGPQNAAMPGISSSLTGIDWEKVRRTTIYLIVGVLLLALGAWVLVKQ